MRLIGRIITFLVISIFFLQNSLAKPSEGGSKSSSGGSKSSSGGSKTSSGGSKTTSNTSTGRADRDQQGGSKAPTGGNKTASGGSKTTSNTSTGRADRDQQGGSKAPTGGNKTPTAANKTPTGGNKTASGGSKTTSNTSTGRADRDQQGGSKAPTGGNKTPTAANKTPTGGNKTASGGSKTTSNTSTGRADRDQQGSSQPANSNQKPPVSAISNVISGAKTLADRAIDIGKSAAVKTKDAVAKVIEPHYNAVKAGIEAQKKAPMGTIGAGSFGYQLSQERAYYKGVEDYYEKNNIENKFAPTGPMAAKMRGKELNELEQALVTAIDKAYRDSAVIVANPKNMSEEHMQQLIGKDLYNELKQSPTQYLGFKNSTVVFGGRREIAQETGKFAGEIYMNNAYYIDNIEVIFVKNEEKKSKEVMEFRDYILHESQHAGDWNLYNHAVNDDQSELANRIVEILQPVVEGKQNPDIAMTFPEYYNPNATFEEGYYTTLSEMRAFAQTDNNNIDWAEGFAQRHHLDMSEAMVIGNIMLNSPVMQRDLQITDEYATQMLGGK